MDSETDYAGGAIDRVNRVLARPLIGNVDTVHLFLTIGVVMVAIIVWSRVLAHIKG